MKQKLLNAVKSRDCGTPAKTSSRHRGIAAIIAALTVRIRTATQRFPVRLGPQYSVLSPRNCVTLANIAEGTHLSSQGITYEADAAITERFLLVKRGSASNRIAICGAADIPIAVCSDEAAAAADVVNVRPFNSDLTLLVKNRGAATYHISFRPDRRFLRVYFPGPESGPDSSGFRLGP